MRSQQQTKPQHRLLRQDPDCTATLGRHVSQDWEEVYSVSRFDDGDESGHTGILPGMKLVSRRVETGYFGTVFPNALSMKSMSA